MKMVLNKSSDEYLALLNYIDTPLHHGYSLAQLSIGRKLCTRVQELMCTLNQKGPMAKNVGPCKRFNQPNLKSKMIFNKSKTTARLTQRTIFITIVQVIRPSESTHLQVNII